MTRSARRRSAISAIRVVGCSAVRSPASPSARCRRWRGDCGCGGTTKTRPSGEGGTEMSFWSWLTGGAAGETPNANPGSSVGPPSYHPGDPRGVVMDPAADGIATRGLPSMPAYRVRAGRALPPTSWMTMPAAGLYTSWAEFAKTLFWDYLMGEAFL